MLFSDLRSAFLESLRMRVRNGELTERSLARMVGISQPHIHNVLKGLRTLSPEMMDRCLTLLRLSVLDLVDKAVLARYLGSEDEDGSRYSYVPFVEGALGPGHPWPTAIVKDKRFPVSRNTAARMEHPVVVQLAADSGMYPLFEGGDLALLDQSQSARTEIRDDGLYVIRQGDSGQLRRIRRQGDALFLASEDSLSSPSSWERLTTEGHYLPHFVRARALLLGRELNWAY